MSKHLGNILEPMPLMDEHGADARALVHGCRPARRGRPRRVGHNAIQEIVRKVLLTYWNTVAFHVLYARTAGWTPRRAGAAGRPSGRCSTAGCLPRPHGSTDDVTAALDDFDTQRAGQLLAQFVDDLSNWYVRRSRRRFWQRRPGRAGAPCTRRSRRAHPADGPADAVHHRAGLAGPRRAGRPRTRPESVHLVVVAGRRHGHSSTTDLVAGRWRWPAGWSSSGRARARRGRGQDPPAAAARPGRGAGVGAALRDELRAEIARGAQRRRARVASRGRRDARRPHREGQLPRARQAVRQADAQGRRRDRRGRRARRWRSRWPRPARPRSRSTARRSSCPPTMSSSPSGRARAGRSSTTQGETVALDLELTPELRARRAAPARSIRLIQEARKNSGLDVSRPDRPVVAGRRRHGRGPADARRP